MARIETIEDTNCKLSCCKTPFRCVTGYGCDHHQIDYEAALDRRDQPVVRYATAGA